MLGATDAAAASTRCWKPTSSGRDALFLSASSAALSCRSIGSRARPGPAHRCGMRGGATRVQNGADSMNSSVGNREGFQQVKHPGKQGKREKEFGGEIHLWDSKIIILDEKKKR